MIRKSLRLYIFCFLGLFLILIIGNHKHEKLFTEKTNNPELLELNERFTPGFFQSANPFNTSSIPFKKTKSRNALRIFILIDQPDSQMLFNPNASFPHILRGIMQRNLPEKEIELVSILLKNSNSFIQYKIVQQLKNYNADLVLICAGRDEFAFSKDSYKKTIDTFEKKLNKMIAALQMANIPVALINSANNMLDYPPQRSLFSSPDSTLLKTLFEDGKAAYLNNDYALAYSYFNKIYRKDKTHAATLFYLGKIALKENDIQTARSFMQQAVDNDNPKLRTPSDINRVIFKTAATCGIPLIDIEKAFENISMKGIAGNDLFLGPDEVNLTGNIIIARECYNSLVKEKYLPENRLANLALSLTPFDTAYDNICSDIQLKDAEVISSNIDRKVISSFEEKTVLQFADRQAGWEESMNKLYEYYIANKNYHLAFKIIENLALENPYDAAINGKASKTASLIGDSQLVVHYAKKCYDLKPRIDIAEQLFLAYLKLDMPENALPYLEYVRKDKINRNKLNQIYTATLSIIDLKKLLKNNPEDKAIRQQIACRYHDIGNYDLASLYVDLSKSSLIQLNR